MSDHPKPADRLRAIAVGASAAAMVLIPTLGPPLAGTEEGAGDYDTEITPPDYAFSIWAPIFASIAANAIQHAARPAAGINRRTGWWLAGAYSANAGWSLAAQTGRFRYTPAILPAATVLAARAHYGGQHDEPHGAQRLAPHSTGLLLGWTSVASVVNAFAVRRRGRFAATTRTGRAASNVALAGTAVALTAGIAASRRGYLSMAAAGTWALTTSALNPERMPRTRAISALGATLIATTAAAKLFRRRRRK